EMADEELEASFVAAIATEAAQRQTQLQQMISENQVNLARAQGAAAVAQQEQTKCAHHQLANSRQVACINRHNTLSMCCFVSDSLILCHSVHCALTASTDQRADTRATKSTQRDDSSTNLHHTPL
ncbi:MAG: hypothetical protein VX670_03680, partial [Candidatus Latescibacterota bacterium]|nr:hypothetical protein [Candidatus Latescibacterota bacterium]